MFSLLWNKKLFKSRCHNIYKTTPSQFHHLQKGNGWIPPCRKDCISKITVQINFFLFELKVKTENRISGVNCGKKCCDILGRGNSTWRYIFTSQINFFFVCRTVVLVILTSVSTLKIRKTFCTLLCTSLPRRAKNHFIFLYI